MLICRHIYFYRFSCTGHVIFVLIFVTPIQFVSMFFFPRPIFEIIVTTMLFVLSYLYLSNYWKHICFVPIYSVIIFLAVHIFARAGIRAIFVFIFIRLLAIYMFSYLWKILLKVSNNSIKSRYFEEKKVFHTWGHV